MKKILKENEIYNFTKHKVTKILPFYNKAKYSENFKKFAVSYFKEIEYCYSSLDFTKIEMAYEIIESKIKSNKNIFVCGNGGSASIANHFVADYSKLIQTQTNLLPKIISLSSNIELISAISNDISYDNVFSFQINTLSKPKDLLIVISSSGSSKNIIEVMKVASKQKLDVISLTGFDGGLAKKLADINLHVNSNNYGIIEDIHQNLMHIFSQFISHKNAVSYSKKNEYRM